MRCGQLGCKQRHLYTPASWLRTPYTSQEQGGTLCHQGSSILPARGSSSRRTASVQTGQSCHEPARTAAAPHKPRYPVRYSCTMRSPGRKNHILHHRVAFDRKQPLSVVGWSLSCGVSHSQSVRRHLQQHAHRHKEHDCASDISPCLVTFLSHPFVLHGVFLCAEGGERQLAWRCQCDVCRL